MVFLLAVTALAFVVRLKFLPYESSDYLQLVRVWFADLRSGGGFAAIGRDFGDYTPPYFYLLALLTYLPGKDLYLIKGLSFAGDILAAYFTMRTVRMKYDAFWGEIAYAVILFLPGTILDSAAWGQCDSLYAAGLMACVCFVLENRQYAAMTAFSLALCLRPQALFLAPFLLLMLMRGRLQWRSLALIPGIYAAAMLPAFFAGRSFFDLILVYLRQWLHGSMPANALPNLAVWYPKDLPRAAGLAISVVAVLLVLAGVLVFRQMKFEMSDEMIVSLALLSALVLPFFLPWMNERCFYTADLLAVAYAFFFPEKFYIPLLTALTSAYTMSRSLFGAHFLNVKLLSVLMFGCLLWVAVSTVFLSRDKKVERMTRVRWKK